MPDEQNYEPHLLSYEEAFQRVWGSERMALRYAWEVYCDTIDYLHQQAQPTQPSPQSGTQFVTSFSHVGAKLFPQK
jgi:hypothetical protein